MIHGRMLEIFGGRTDSYGQDVPKDGDPGKGGMRVDGPVTPDLMKKHLQGELGVGLYPTWHGEDDVLMASWGCCDIDTGDWSEAWALVRALRAMNMVPHVERSRSKGWHIWVFPTEPVTARQMRRALKVAYAAIELPAKEANPKQEDLKPGQVGNYVRLPYKGSLKAQPQAFQRQCFMVGYDGKHDGFPLGVTDWVYEFDHGCLTQASEIRKWAARWTEPERAHVGEVRTFEDEELKELVHGLRGELFLFVKNGPKHDRSAGMVALAHKLKSARYTATEAFNILCIADEHWGGKYAERGEAIRDKYIIDIVERAYA